jgi:PTS system fructose-specific IIA component
MELHELLTPERIMIIDDVQTKKEDVLREIYRRCQSISGFKEHSDEIWVNLLEREKSMSTGIGLGIAIPHCSTEFVTDVVAMLALVKNGVDFQAIDDIPVKIIILLLLPKNKFEKHIKTLASVAKLFNDEKIRESILRAAEPAEIFHIIERETKSAHM